MKMKDKLPEKPQVSKHSLTKKVKPVKEYNKARQEFSSYNCSRLVRAICST